MDGRFQNLVLVATGIASLNLCEPAECTTSREPPPVYCEADDVIDAAQVPYFVDILLNPDVTFEEVCYSEKMLATGPMKEVINELLPLLDFLYTEPEICLGGGGSPQGFLLCPYPWPSARAASRVFRTYLDKNWGPTSADLARQLLRDEEYSVLFPILLHYLNGDWKEGDDGLAYSLFADNRADFRIRRAAAGVLLRKSPWQSYDIILDVCEEADEPLRSYLAVLLLETCRANEFGQDTRLIRLVLDVIQRNYRFAPVDLRMASLLASSLRCLLGLENDLPFTSNIANGNVASINLRIRREIEEVIADTLEYLEECDSDSHTNGVMGDSPL